MDKESLLYEAMPHLMMEIISKYFRLEVEGEENIPRKGAGLIVPNHSGFSGFDAAVLAHQVREKTTRIPRVLTHHFWFISETVALPMQKMGFIEATLKNGNKALVDKELVVIFPEGEYGNFKPSADRYHLQRFRRGFIRMALTNQCPIIPTLILGAEETHINLARLKLTKYLKGTVLPVPLNILPLPARWKIVFLKPIHLPYGPEAAKDRELVVDLANQVREEMQERLSEEVSQRKHIYF